MTQAKPLQNPQQWLAFFFFIVRPDSTKTRTQKRSIDRLLIDIYAIRYQVAEAGRFFPWNLLQSVGATRGFGADSHKSPSTDPNWVDAFQTLDGH